MTLVSQKKRILKCSAVRMGGAIYATIILYLRFTIRWIASSSSFNSKTVWDSILSVIFWKVIFVTVYVVLYYILYFASPVCRTMCIEDRTESLLYIIILPIISLLPDIIVSPNLFSSIRDILEASPLLFSFLGYVFISYLLGDKFSIPSTQWYFDLLMPVSITP